MNPGGATSLNITLASTDASRAQVHALFDEPFHDMAPDAVPKTSGDYLYNPTVAQVHDSAAIWSLRS